MCPENHYSQLGLDNDAVLHDIRQAYYNRARRHHPDRGGNSKDFGNISRVYNILTEPSERMMYDSYCTYRQSESCWPLFMPNENIYKLQVRLEDVCKGIVVPFTFDRITIENTTGMERCRQCLGSTIDEIIQNVGNFTTTSFMQCKQCTYGFDSCQVPRNRVTIHVEIPPGCPDGTFLRLPEQGDQLAGNRNCDLVLKIMVLPHDGFKVRMDTLDLDYMLTISTNELQNGFHRHVQHPNGQVLNICSMQSLVEGTYSHVGHGISYGQTTGNLYVQVVVREDVNVQEDDVQHVDTSLPLLSMVVLPPTIVGN